MVFSPLEKLDSYAQIPSRRPLAVMSFLMLITLGLALARLFELTVIGGRENRDRADQNRILVRPIHAPRGVILDRTGIALTRNVPSIRLIDLPGDDLGPIPIEAAARSYPFGQALAHVVGYVGEKDFSPGEVAGISGLEKQYDYILRGVDGAQLIEVNANGETLRTISTQTPVPGQNLTVNLDANLSVAALAAVSGKKAAVAALDPADGSVLALVSSPSFDPDNVAAAVSDTENLPLFNRPVSGEYPPGSIFKLVTAAAALSENKISRVTLIEDTGEIRVGDFRYGNWYFDQYGRTEGAINITRAIARSNDIFFYRVGEWLGPQALADWGRRLGLGQKTGIDLPAEADGLIPDPAWKEHNIGEKWYLGNTYHMAIGQGDVRVTPLQVAQMISAVVTGKLCRPHLSREGSDISVSARGSDPSCQDILVSAENRNLILEGMVGACSPGGTAFPFFDWNSKGSTFAACKTGTAQHGGPKTPPHAWISLAAPIAEWEGSDPSVNVDGSDPSSTHLDLDSPKRIILVVLVEESGEGSAVAAPLAKQILTEWFNNKN